VSRTTNQWPELATSFSKRYKASRHDLLRKARPKPRTAALSRSYSFCRSFNSFTLLSKSLAVDSLKRLKTRFFDSIFLSARANSARNFSNSELVSIICRLPCAASDNCAKQQQLKGRHTVIEQSR